MRRSCTITMATPATGASSTPRAGACLTGDRGEIEAAAVRSAGTLAERHAPSERLEVSEISGDSDRPSSGACAAASRPTRRFH
jgi:hypothetical protein